MVRSINPRDIAGKAVIKGWSVLNFVQNFVGVLSLVGALTISIMGTQRYTQLKNDIKSAVTPTVTHAEMQFKQGKISQTDLDNIKTKAENKNIHYGRDILDSVKQFNYSGVWDNLGKLYYNIIDPSQALQNVDDIKTSYEQTLIDRDKQFSDIETALDKMVSTSCSKDSVQEYLDALNVVKNLKLSIQEYENKAGKIEIKCIEDASFSDLSNKVLKLIKDMKSNHNSNEIAHEVGCLFGGDVTKVEDIYNKAPNLTPGEKQEMQNYLVFKTKELSEIVSKELGDLVKLDGYL